MGKINCKKEFLEEVRGKEVLCALVKRDAEYDGSQKEYALPVGYSLNKLAYFLADLEFKYDAGYGAQKIFGYIWYKDGTWSERGEYDGSEWWEHKVQPEIPERLRD